MKDPNFPLAHLNLDNYDLICLCYDLGLAPAIQHNSNLTYEESELLAEKLCNEYVALAPGNVADFDIFSHDFSDSEIAWIKWLDKKLTDTIGD